MNDISDGQTLNDPPMSLAEAERLLIENPAAMASKAREVIAAEPSNAEAYRLLGAALRRLGQNDEANSAELAAIDASAQDPEIASAANAMMSGDLPAAEAILRRVLTRRPNDVAAIRMIGEIAASFGYLRDAEALLRRALELAPGFDYARLHLAMVLHNLNRSGEALAELDRIEGEELNLIEEVKALRAAALARVGEEAKAIALYREIVDSDPNNLECWTSLAFLEKSSGHPDEAVKACRSALEVSPGHGEAWWMLADLKTYEFSDLDLASLHQELDSPVASDDDKLRMHFALGKALEDRKQIDESFGHYREGNALRAAQVQHDPTRIRGVVERTEALFTPEFLKERMDSGDPSPDPIFVVGMPRSGSTLVEQILASHPSIEGTSELADIYVIAANLEPDPRFSGHWQDYPQLLGKLPPETFNELGRLYIERTRIQRKTDRPFFIDKMPNNWLHSGFIQLILPNAKIIDVRRHPVACGFSNFKQLYARGHEFSYDLAHFGEHYSDYVRLMSHFDRVTPGRIHRVLHERLVEDPEGEIRRLLDYVGVPFDEACLRFHETKRAVRTASAEQVRRPMRSAVMDAWRPFEPYLDPLKSSLGSTLDDWNENPG